jgi:histone deacetylase 11
VFAYDPGVFLFDLYNRDIYPHDTEARRRIDCDLPVPSGYDDSRYLATVTKELPRFLDALCAPGKNKPRLAFYNAGTDVLAGDPLGRMNVSADGIYERDRFVIDAVTRRGIPCVVLPSGGYTRQSYRLVARTAAWVLETGTAP